MTAVALLVNGPASQPAPEGRLWEVELTTFLPVSLSTGRMLHRGAGTLRHSGGPSGGHQPARTRDAAGHGHGVRSREPYPVPSDLTSAPGCHS